MFSHLIKMVKGFFSTKKIEPIVIKPLTKDAVIEEAYIPIDWEQIDNLVEKNYRSWRGEEDSEVYSPVVNISNGNSSHDTLATKLDHVREAYKLKRINAR